MQQKPVRAVKRWIADWRRLKQERPTGASDAVTKAKGYWRSTDERRIAELGLLETRACRRRDDDEDWACAWAAISDVLAVGLQARARSERDPAARRALLEIQDGVARRRGEFDLSPKLEERVDSLKQEILG